MTTTAKPRLTRSMAKKLLSLASFAKCEAEPLFTGTPDQWEEAHVVTEAAEWLRELAHWKLDQKK